jgi:hypothetical protein
MKLLAIWIVVGLPAVAASLGKVAELPDACPAGAGGLPKTACRQVTVSCPGLRDLRAQLRITQPVGTLRGTVVLGSGGNGAGFYAAQPPVQALVRDLSDMGFLVVDRSWDGGWVTKEGGLKLEACRYATLLTWVHDTLHRGGKFVATGNSGGSAEIGYALTTYGRAAILDAAIPTSGPPLSRLDYTCAARPTPEWTSLCASLIPEGAIECKPGCMLGPANDVCKQVADHPTSQQLLNDSVVHPGAEFDYPHTRVDFFFGADDCGEPVPAGLAYASKITSEKAIHFVPRTPHALFSTPEGREAIRKAIEAAAPAQPPQ